MQPKSIPVLVVTLVLFVALSFVIGDWSAERVVAEPPQEAALQPEQPQAATPFAMVSFAEDEEEEEFEEDEEEFEEEEHEWDLEEEEIELELHQRHLEVAMAEMETSFGRLELVNRVAEIADDHTLSAAFAVTHVIEFLDDEDAVIEFLTDALDSAPNPGVTRLIRMKLAEVYANTDQPEKAKDQLMALITGQ